MKITPYDLRVAPADRKHGTLRYGRDAAAEVVTIATTTSGSGAPAWMRRAAAEITRGAVTTLGEARAIAAEVYTRRYLDRPRPLPPAVDASGFPPPSSRTPGGSGTRPSARRRRGARPASTTPGKPNTSAR